MRSSSDSISYGNKRAFSKYEAFIQKEESKEVIICHENLHKEYVKSHYDSSGNIKEGIKFPEIPYRKHNFSRSPEVETYPQNNRIGQENPNL